MYGSSGRKVAEALMGKKIKYRTWKRENSTEAWKEYKKSRENAKRVIFSKKKKQKECASYLMILSIKVKFVE